MLPSINKARTLIDEIDECSKKGNRKKAYLEENEALCSFFLDYYGGKDNPAARPAVLNKAICEILADQDNLYEDVISGIRSYFQDKYLLTSRLENVQTFKKKFWVRI